MKLDIKIDRFSYKIDPFFLKQNFSINEGITGVIGNNGTGKSTLIKLISGDMESNVSIIDCNGKNIIPGYNLDILYIQDDFIGLEYLNILEVAKYYHLIYNLHFNLALFSEYVFKLNINCNLINEIIKNLSKGTKQKVVCLIYFMIKRPVILFDESLENIDGKTIVFIENELTNYVRDVGRICLIATHSNSILNMADQYLHLSCEQGSSETTIKMKKNFFK